MIDAEQLLREARSKLEAAESRVKKLREFVDMYQEMVAEHSINVAPTTDASAAKNGQESDDTEFVDRVKKRGAETEALAIRIIRDLGRPVSTRDMLVEVQKRGLKITGKNPRATLLTRLSRATGLKNIPGVGWAENGSPETVKEKPPAMRAA